MKKTLLVLLLLFLCVLTACGTEIREVTEVDGLILTVDRTMALTKETQISFTIINNGVSTWKVGESIHIEYCGEGGEWEELPKSTPLILSVTKLQPNAKMTQEYLYEQILEKGKYRLSLFLESIQSGEATALRSEFQID